MAVLRTLICVVLAGPALALAQTAPAPGTASGSLAVAGKSATLSHAVAFNAGARIYLVVSDQVVKTTGKGEAEKLKVDVTFNAPFGKPSPTKP
jgi:hypothetical protein